MKLVKITQDFAIFKHGKQIIAKPITPQARKIHWNNRNIPANWRCV